MLGLWVGSCLQKDGRKDPWKGRRQAERKVKDRRDKNSREKGERPRDPSVEKTSQKERAENARYID